MIQKKIKKWAVAVARKFGLKKVHARYGINRDELPDFFKKLNDMGCRYAVLRWFDELPNIKEGEDIDMLVEDETFFEVRKLCRCFRPSKEKVMVDIYPVSNLIANFSYYVPELATRILEGRVQNKNGVYVPNPKDYFFSLSYHTLFHKGLNSGVPTKYRDTDAVEYKHDFNRILPELADKAGVKLPSGFTMEKLESVLSDYDWLPPLDVYFRRSKLNQWAYQRAQDWVPDEWRHNQNTVVFILRDKVCGTTIEQKLRELISKNNAVILREEVLTDEQAKYFMKKTRGGDWGPSYKASAGPSRLVMIVRKGAVDPNSSEQTPVGDVLYEWVKNIKNNIRETYIKQAPPKERYHIFHSSDNGIEAAYYEYILDETINSFADITPVVV